MSNAKLFLNSTACMFNVKKLIVWFLLVQVKLPVTGLGLNTQE